MVTLFDWKPCSTVDCLCINHHIPTYSSASPPSLADMPAIQALCCTNEEPCFSEEAALRSFLRDIEEHIGASEDALDRFATIRETFAQTLAIVDARMAKLHKLRRGLYASAKDAKDLLSPLRRMPSEIMTHIFSYLAPLLVDVTLQPDSRRVPTWNMHHPEEDLWRVELVCKRWRSQVISCSKLWTNINIPLRGAHFVPPDWRHLKRIGTQLSRAASQPLSVCIHEVGRSDQANIKPALLGILFSFAPRIKHLKVFLPPVLIEKLAPLKYSFSSLESLYIHHDLTTPRVSNYDAFVAAPVLRSVGLVDVEYVPATFNWAEITSFSSTYLPLEARRRLDGISTTNFLGLLWTMKKKLQSCTMRCEKTVDVDDVSLQQHGVRGMIVCQSLTSLTILSGFGTQGAAWHILARVRLPVLEHLTVNDRFELAECVPFSPQSDDVLGALCAMVARSQCPLISLNFTHGPLHDGLIPLLRDTPTLRELRLVDIEDVYNEASQYLLVRLLKQLVVDDLPSTSTSDVLVPHLHTLHLTGFLAFKSNHFCDMAMSRWARTDVAGLRDIRLGWRATNTKAEYSDSAPAMRYVYGPRPQEQCVFTASLLEHHCPKNTVLDITVLPSVRGEL